jgi:hypothetical protein
MTITAALLVMSAHLCSGEDKGLCLDCPRSQQYLPVCPASRNGEGRWVGYNLCTLAFQCQADFGKSQLFDLSMKMDSDREGDGFQDGVDR